MLVPLSSHEVAFNTDIRSLRSTSECSVMHFANKNSKERLLEERFSLHSDGSGGEWVMLNGLLRHPESMTIVTQGVAAGAAIKRESNKMNAHSKNILTVYFWLAAQH